jgi:uncharacterized protein (DUF1697 family)
MNRLIALYRGINVGGKNIVKMESLRAMHTRLGHQDVATYIQSGNVVFSATGSPAAIAKKLATAFNEDFGFDARVMVVPESRWNVLIRGNPYSKHCAQNPKTVHVCVCEGDPDPKGLKALLEKTRGTERFETGPGVIYLHSPDGMGNSKFAAGMEKASGVPITARNWTTMEALLSMLNGASASKPRNQKTKSRATGTP